LAQSQGGDEFQPADILKYFEGLKRGPNAEVGPIDFFEIAFIRLLTRRTAVHRKSLRKTCDYD